MTIKELVEYLEWCKYPEGPVFVELSYDADADHSGFGVVPNIGWGFTSSPIEAWNSPESWKEYDSTEPDQSFLLPEE